MDTHGGVVRSVQLVLIALVIAFAAFGAYKLLVADDGETATAVSLARDSIAELKDVVAAREEALVALRATHAAAIATSDSVAAWADTVQERNERLSEAADVAVDSLAVEIRDRVDSATAVLVDELVAEHDVALASAAESLRAELRRSAGFLARAVAAETIVSQQDSTIASYKLLIEQSDVLDGLRRSQIRRLKWQRRGTLALLGAAAACAAAC